MKQVSKLRNIFGEPKKEKFTDIAMAEVTSEGSLIAVNSTFLGVSWQSVKGCVGIFDANVPTRIPSEIPLIRGHDSYISDLKVSPFRANLLSTASDDTTVKLWEIPMKASRRTSPMKFKNSQNITEKSAMSSLTLSAMTSSPLPRLITLFRRGIWLKVKPFAKLVLEIALPH